VSLVHTHELRLNRDVLVFNGAADCVTQDNNPLISLLFYLRYENAILSAGDNLLESTHVLHVLLVD
jgi:hypothetical protein